MKIFVDDGLSLTKKLTGIGYYSQDLIHVLQSLGHEVYTRKYSKIFLRLPLILKRLYYMVIVNKLAFTSKYDLIIYTNNQMPALKHKARVWVTIHDLSVFLYRETFSWIYSKYTIGGIKNAVKYADQILTVSESAKQELMNYFCLKTNKVQVVYGFVRNKFENLAELNVGEKKKYFLFVGVIEKRKNIKILCQAFKIFKQEYPEYSLCLVGKPGFGFKEISQEFNDESICYLNYVSNQELIHLYSESVAFVFPSLYEGLGLPVLEAMKMNLPIIASAIPTNIELNNRHQGDFIFFDPYNVIDIVAALKKSLLLKRSVNRKYENLEMYTFNSISMIYKEILTNFH